MKLKTQSFAPALAPTHITIRAFVELKEKFSPTLANIAELKQPTLFSVHQLVMVLVEKLLKNTLINLMQSAKVDIVQRNIEYLHLMLTLKRSMRYTEIVHQDMR